MSSRRWPVSPHRLINVPVGGSVPDGTSGSGALVGRFGRLNCLEGLTCVEGSKLDIRWVVL